MREKKREGGEESFKLSICGGTRGYTRPIRGGAGENILSFWENLNDPGLEFRGGHQQKDKIQKLGERIQEKVQ